MKIIGKEKKKLSCLGLLGHRIIVHISENIFSFVDNFN